MVNQNMWILHLTVQTKHMPSYIHLSAKCHDQLTDWDMRRLKCVISIWHIKNYMQLYICSIWMTFFFFDFMHCYLNENWQRYKISIMTSQCHSNQYLFSHCKYLCRPSEWHFFSDFNTPKHMLFGSILSEIWGDHCHFPIW